MIHGLARHSDSTRNTNDHPAHPQIKTGMEKAKKNCLDLQQTPGERTDADLLPLRLGDPEVNNLEATASRSDTWLASRHKNWLSDMQDIKCHWRKHNDGRNLLLPLKSWALWKSRGHRAGHWPVIINYRCMGEDLQKHLFQRSAFQRQRRLIWTVKQNLVLRVFHVFFCFALSNALSSEKRNLSFEGSLTSAHSSILRTFDAWSVRFWRKPLLLRELKVSLCFWVSGPFKRWWLKL